MRYGYQDKLLRINLSTGSGFNRAAPGDEMVDKFIGGRGFVAKLLFDELPRGIDPMTRKTFSSPPPDRCPAIFCRPAARPILAPSHRLPAAMRTATWAAISARP
jgi:hypothetical protein